MSTLKYVKFLEQMSDIESSLFSSLCMTNCLQHEPRIGRKHFVSYHGIVVYFSARTITAETNQNNNHFDHDDDDGEEEELMRLKQQERTKSRTSMKGTSRPSSAAKRKNSISSRPSSVAMFQHPL